MGALRIAEGTDVSVPVRDSVNVVFVHLFVGDLVFDDDFVGDLVFDDDCVGDLDFVVGYDTGWDEGSSVHCSVEGGDEGDTLIEGDSLS